MNSIGVVVAVVCIASLGCSIISIIAPQGNTRRILNTVIGCFILCSMLVPIKNAITDFNVNINITPPSEDLSVVANEAYNKAVMTETKATLESTLSAYLTNNNYPVQDIEITLESYDDGGIYINNISIYISKEQEINMDKIKSLTKKKFEVEPQIVLR